MKEIKAYVRKSLVNQIVKALGHAGAPGITLVEGHPVGYGYDPEYFTSPIREALKSARPIEIVRLEVVCADSDVEQLVQVVLEGARTGHKGDGLIVVSDVARAIRIRDGASGEDTLARSV